jgi:hypothetical protein
MLFFLLRLLHTLIESLFCCLLVWQSFDVGVAESESGQRTNRPTPTAASATATAKHPTYRPTYLPISISVVIMWWNQKQRHMNGGYQPSLVTIAAILCIVVTIGVTILPAMKRCSHNGKGWLCMTSNAHPCDIAPLTCLTVVPSSQAHDQVTPRRTSFCTCSISLMVLCYAVVDICERTWWCPSVKRSESITQ